MERNLEKFDFQATVRAVGDAVVSVICHILFDFALVGIGVAVVLSICAFVLGQRKHHFARPFYVVARRIATACAALSVPGFGFLIVTGHLPASGVYLNFGFGFLVLWSMVTIYLCAEEMNFEWFTRGEQSPQVIEDETAVVSSSAQHTSGANTPKTSRSQVEAPGDIALKFSREEETPVGDVTLKLPREEETPVGDVTVKLPRKEETPVGDVTVKLPRKEETPVGDVTLKLPREEETAVGDVTLKLPREEKTAVGDVTLKLPREEEIPVGDVTIKLPREEETTIGDVALRS